MVIFPMRRLKVASPPGDAAEEVPCGRLATLSCITACERDECLFM